MGALFLAAFQPAAAQQASSVAPFSLTPSQGADPSGDSAGDLLTPQNLIQFQSRVTTAPGTDLNGDPNVVTTQRYKLRGDLSFNLNPVWQMVLRGDLPFVVKNPVSDSNPQGDFIHGVGDSDVQAAVIHAFDERWKAGVGVRLIAPTGGDLYGSGKWQAMPVVGLRYSLLELGSGDYIEPLLRWDVSFAGDPTRRNISNLQLAPMVNFTLPERWFVTLYPSTDIRWNFGDPVTGQTGRLFLPFDARIGKKFSDSFNMSLEVGVPIVKQYPVYNFKTALNMNLTF
ncbi:MAG TPA: hypothetical protein VMU18_10700 [Rhodoblastus sp.]|nr:hypothetical protein [Rhodoblastus sp.]